MNFETLEYLHWNIGALNHWNIGTVYHWNILTLEHFTFNHLSQQNPITLHKCNETQITKQNQNRCWDSVGMNLEIVAIIMCSQNFLFGTEIRMFRINPEGGWSGFGMETVGIYPNNFKLHPNTIPTGGVV